MPVPGSIAQAILSQRAPDLVGSFQQGRQQARQQRELDRQERARALAGQALQGQEGALQELQGLAPEVALQIGESIGTRNQKDISEFIQDARIGENLLAQGNVEGFLSFANGREAAIRARGGNTEQTSRISSLVRQGRVEEARRELKAFSDTVNQAKQLGTKAFAPVEVVNPETGERQLVTPTFDPNTNRAAFSQAQLPEGFQLAEETAQEKRLRETEERLKRARQKGDVDVDVAGRKEGVKSAEARRSDAITGGLEAAAVVPKIRRSLQLLDTVETGGFDAVALRAKQIFGVEGADEAELTNNLARSVLSQLKTIFGAQFTVEEGNRLERIEAGIGKSTEGNKRILKQLLKEYESKANRGIRAARSGKTPDELAAFDIEEALNFNFQATGQPAPQAEPAAAPAQERQRIRFDAQGNII